jgi:putative glutamine amidotransferase
MSVIIGIVPGYENGKFQLKKQYSDAIIYAGGTPIIIPYTEDRVPEDFFEIIDGLLLTGGADVAPSLYGQEPVPELGEVVPERDIFELMITREFIKTGKPLLGICRGLQLLNVALGGSLYQDIPSCYKPESPVQHRQNVPASHNSHSVKVEPSSKLFSITSATEFLVNSFHHQAVKDPASSLKATAWSPDGIIEAAEGVAYPFMLAVQWHPEESFKGNENGLIFQAFVDACGK